MTQQELVNIGPRTAGARRGMIVRDRATGKRGEIVEVADGNTPWTIWCFFLGDVAVEMEPGYRVCGPESYFWTLFDLEPSLGA